MKGFFMRFRQFIPHFIYRIKFTISNHINIRIFLFYWSVIITIKFSQVNFIICTAPMNFIRFLFELFIIILYVVYTCIMCIFTFNFCFFQSFCFSLINIKYTFFKWSTRNSICTVVIHIKIHIIIFINNKSFYSTSI